MQNMKLGKKRLLNEMSNEASQYEEQASFDKAAPVGSTFKFKSSSLFHPVNMTASPVFS